MAPAPQVAMQPTKKTERRRAGPIDSTVPPLSVEYVQRLSDMSTLETVEDMVEDTLHGGVAMQFVQWFLNPKVADSRSTKGMQDLRSDWPRRGTRSKLRRTTLFAQSISTCFLSLTTGALVLEVSMWMPTWRVYPGSKHPYLLEQSL